MATVLGLTTLAVAPAHADEPSVTVTLTSMTPAVTDGSGTLTITGRIQNTSTTALRHVQVYLWRDTTPATTATALDDILASDSTSIVGRRAIDTEKATWEDLTPNGESFAAGQSATFTVSAPVSRLGFTTPGVYPVGVQVRSELANGSTVTTGRARTLLPFRQKSQKLAWSPVIELTSRPSLVTAGVFSDNHLLGELTGRLQQLVARARDRRATVVVDPALLDEVQALTTTHTVAGNKLSTDDQRAATATAQGWLDQVKNLLHTNPSYRLPYGNADLTTLLTAHDARTRDALATAPTSSNPAASLPLAVVTDNVSSDLLAFVRPMHPALVVSPGALTGTDATTGLTVRGVSETFGQGGPSPDPQTTLVQRRQHALSDALIAAIGYGSQPLGALISSSADLALEASVNASATAQPLESDTDSEIDSSSWTPTPSQIGTAGAWQQARDAAARDFDTWGELTNRATEAQQMGAQAFGRSLSLNWPNPGAGFSSLAASAGALGDVLSSRAVHANMVQEFVLSSPENRLPATVTNNLDTTVTVQLTFISENPQRVDIPPTDTVTVPPGETVTVEFHPRAYTNGSVNVTAQLRTISGRPVGPELPIVVRATSLGRVGWIIIILSGALFLGATAMRVRQVQRERAREGTADDAATLQPSPPVGVEDSAGADDATTNPQTRTTTTTPAGPKP